MKLKSAILFPMVVLCSVAVLSITAHASTVITDMLLDPSLLKSAGLESVWQVNLPLQKAETNQRMYVFGGYVYVLTNQNYLYVIDVEQQAFRFGLLLAPRGLPVCEPLSHAGQVWFMVGTDLIAVDPARNLEFRRQLKQVVRAPLGAYDSNHDRLYVPGGDGRLHSIVLDGYWQDFMVAPDDGSPVTSIVAGQERVVFATEGGQVVCIWSDKPKKRWAFDIVGRITAPVVGDDDWLYVSGQNAKLHKLDIRNGRPAWKEAFHAGEPLKKSVFLGEHVVYQSTEGLGVYAIDKKTGQSLWNVRQGIDVLVEIGTRAYVFAEPGKLVVMDNQQGHLYSINFAPIRKYAINRADASLYVADLQGRVMCIKERSRQ